MWCSAVIPMWALLSAREHYFPQPRLSSTKGGTPRAALMNGTGYFSLDENRRPLGALELICRSVEENMIRIDLHV